ncbi:MAG: hypothetical protein JXB24_02840 [Bacteroidales bacterium]|nr:hypothetical protein [Bacteroidales bacterium]
MSENGPENITNKKNSLLLNLFWLGFIVYITSYAVSSTSQISYILVNVLQILGLALLFPSAVMVMQFRIENKYLRTLFILYVFWLLAVVIRGISFDYDSLKQMFFNPLRGALVYFVPLVILMPFNAMFFRKLVGVIMFLGFCFLVFSIASYKQLLFPLNYYLSQGIFENYSQHLSLPLGFVLLTYIYHTNSKNLFALFLMILTFLLAVFRARRGMIFMSFNIIFLAFLVYQWVNKARVVRIVLLGFLIIIAAYAAMNLYENNRRDTFSLITERIDDDTRSEVETYFYRDFKIKDWIIGRGINGQYFCPGVEDGEGRISIYRSVIETGFLQIILNGGIISLLLFMLISIPAMLKGLFHSNNLLTKAAGIWILLFYLYAYPGTPGIFSLNYILVWISIGVCYSHQLRYLTDNDILDWFRDIKTLPKN